MRQVGRRVAVAGALAALAFGAMLATAFAWDAALGRALVAQAAAHLALGRETGVPTGLALGTPPALVGAFAWAQDATVLLVGYGVAGAAGGFLPASWRARLAADGDRTSSLRSRGAPAIVAALAASLWIPFLPTGALTAALVGRAAGVPARVLLPALLVSSLFSVAAFMFIVVSASARVPLWMLAVASATVAFAVAIASRRRAAALAAAEVGLQA